MAIADTITSMQTNTSNAYDMLSNGTDLTGINKNLENLSSTIFEAFLEALRNPDTLFNNLPKTSGSGSNITLNNTAYAPMRITLNPSALSQDATPTPSTPQDIHTISGDNTIQVDGENLCNTFIATKANWQSGTLVVNDDGSFTVSGNTGSNNYFQLNQKVKALCPSLKVGDVVYLYLETTNTNKKVYTSGMSGGGWHSGNSLTITDTILNNNFVIYGGYNQTDTIKITITKGQVATKYVPYKKPQTAPINLPVENLLENILTSTTKNGITAIVNEDKSVTLNGTATELIWLVLNRAFTYEVGDYTISLNPTEEVSGLAIYSDPFGVVGSKKTISITETTTPDVSLRITSGTTLNNVTVYPQIEKGTKANSYTPYGTTPIEYCKIGNYEDRIFKNVVGDTDYSSERDNGGWYIKKNIGKYVANNDLTGNGITTDRIGLLTPELNITPSLSNDNLEVMSKCNLMPTKMTGNTNSNGLQGSTSVSKIRVNLNTTYADSAENANTFLTNNNFTIYYVMATPTYTQITGTLETQLNNIYKNMLSYKGTTNVSQINNDLFFVLGVSAIEDLE